MKKHNEYIETSEFPGNTHLNVSVFYDKGGANYFTCSTDRRGYYISVQPVKKENGCVSHTMFTGIKSFISEANRYSDKQFNLACEAGKAKVPELIEWLRQNKKSA